MKQYIKDISPAFILFTLFWSCNRICMIPKEYYMTKVVHPFGLYVYLSVILGIWLYTIPYENISLKSLVLFLFLSSFLATILYACVQTYLATHYTFSELSDVWRKNPALAVDRLLPGARKILDLWQPLLFFIICHIQIKLKRIDIHKSDTLNNSNIFIVLVYPKNWIGIFLMIFWKLPVTTIKLYYKGYLYGFDKSEGKLIKEKTSYEKLNKCFIRDTKLNISVENILFNLVNVKWSVKRNCLNIFEPVTGKITNYI